MEITTGSRLGPYEIVSRIGAGGMGEVFKARDTRLQRNVAIKVLLRSFGDDTQLRARFEREARVISQLNHQHICTLHDVGEQDGTSFLVMELLEGESLADRLIRGPLPIADVLRYGAQILLSHRFKVAPLLVGVGNRTGALSSCIVQNASGRLKDAQRLVL